MPFPKTFCARVRGDVPSQFTIKIGKKKKRNGPNHDLWKLSVLVIIVTQDLFRMINNS